MRVVIAVLLALLVGCGATENPEGKPQMCLGTGIYHRGNGNAQVYPDGVVRGYGSCTKCHESWNREPAL